MSICCSLNSDFFVLERKNAQIYCLFICVYYSFSDSTVRMTTEREQDNPATKHLQYSELHVLVYYYTHKTVSPKKYSL